MKLLHALGRVDFMYSSSTVSNPSPKTASDLTLTAPVFPGALKGTDDSRRRRRSSSRDFVATTTDGASTSTTSSEEEKSVSASTAGSHRSRNTSLCFCSSHVTLRIRPRRKVNVRVPSDTSGSLNAAQSSSETSVFKIHAHI